MRLRLCVALSACALGSPRAGNYSYEVSVDGVSHAWTPVAPWVPGIPFLAFTGTNDTTAPAEYTERWYDKAGNVSRRGLVNNWSGHHEPDNWEGWKAHDQYNPKLPQFVVAWFKLHLDGVTASEPTDAPVAAQVPAALAV